jgi:hypothetical protein
VVASELEALVGRVANRSIHDDDAGRNTDQSNQENDCAGGDCGSVSQRTRQGWLSQYLYHQDLPDVQDACQPV